MKSDLRIVPGVPPDVKSFFDRQAWVDLNPALNVGQSPPPQILGIDEATGNYLEKLLLEEGYFHIDQVAWNLPLAEMAQAIIRLTERGLIPAFCFMYDEFWLMFHKLHKMMLRLLGEKYAILPDIWAWYVDPRVGESGWPPHRDKYYMALFPDGRPKSLSVWLPLTNATPLNGCIYVVPADRDPTYNKPNDNEWSFKHQDIRALPARPGALLCWTQGLLHWGARSSPRANEPRISLSIEFQRGDVPPMNTPLLPPLAYLTVEQRLALICKQFEQYKHMYPVSTELKALSEIVLSGRRE